MRIRRATSADVPAMMKVELQSPGAAHWSRRQYERLFTATPDPAQSTRVVWVVDNESERSGKDRNENREVLAFLVAHRIDSDWELENLVVAQSVRKRGIGTLLLEKLIAQVRDDTGRSIFLEVRESNEGASRLYQKLGFKEVGLRKGYYQNPPEDAILYRLSLEFS
jgi:ribosomal-protein-alanine N-acetyltransferase